MPKFLGSLDYSLYDFYVANSSISKNDQRTAIAVFAYNRPEKLEACLKSLLRSEESKQLDIWIFQDGEKSGFQDVNHHKTTEVIKGFTKIRDIHLQQANTNLGLQESIILGINHVFEKFSRIIVIEDDLILSTSFIKFCLNYLDIYENDSRVASIHGYAYPIENSSNRPYFLQGADCWGWATWKDRWNHFEPDAKKLLNNLKRKKLEYKFDLNGSVGYSNMLYRQSIGKLNSWAIRWHASMYLENRVTLYPPQSLIRNDGMDGSGTNLKATDVFETELGKFDNFDVYVEPFVSTKILKSLIRYHRKNNRYNLLKIITYKILDLSGMYGKIVFK